MINVLDNNRNQDNRMRWAKGLGGIFSLISSLLPIMDLLSWAGQPLANWLILDWRLICFIH